MGTEFIEVEHKYLVDADFDKKTFAEKLLRLEPLRHEFFSPSDTYFAHPREPGYVYRYRRDHDLQELTVKSRGADIEQRLEINLAMSLTEGDQTEAVRQFLATLDVQFCGTLRKEIELFEFVDAEVVHYTASFGDKVVQCVEFEALKATSLEQAIQTITRYETILGFLAVNRCKTSLFDLLLVKL